MSTTDAERGTATGAADGQRQVALVADSQVVMEGAGVPVRRVLPSRTARYDVVDPFLLLDHFRMEHAGGGSFPPHPHRGFEIITYMVEGSASHSDSEGNQGMVQAGGLQRITAGRGIWHGEGAGGEEQSGGHSAVEGLQLWINLARAQKGIAPGYQGVPPEQIPTRQLGDATVRVLVGEGAPTQLQTPAIYLDVQLPAGGQTALDVPPAYQGFAYVLSGDGRFGSDQTAVSAGQLAILGAGSDLEVRAGGQGARFVLAAARPYREPVRFNGPYVD